MREDFFFPPPADGNAPFRLHLAGTSRCDGSYHIVMHPFDTYYVLEYIESGRGSLKVNGEEVFPEAGDLYLVPNVGDREYSSSADRPWVKHWFNVSGLFVSTLLELYRLENVRIVRRFSRPELFTEGLRRLRENPAQAHLPLGPEIVGAILAQAAADMRRAADAGEPASAEGRILRDLLDRRLAGPMPSLEELGRQICRSKVQTIRIFRRDFGETPHQYLLRRKLSAAAELLQRTDRTIKEIAQEFGFSSEYYFAAVFKQKCGYSPGVFRRHARRGDSIGLYVVPDPKHPGEFVNMAFL